MKIKLLTAAMAVMFCVLFLPACDGGNEAAKKDAPPPADEAAPESGVFQITPEKPADEPAEEAQATGKIELPSHLDEPVVATINGEPITRQLLESQVVMAEAGRLIFGDELDEENDELKTRREQADLELRREILTSLISLELACQEALKMGYAPSDEEVETALDELRNDYDEPDQLHKVLDQYGETEDDLRAQLRKTMALKKWQDTEFLAKVKVGEDEARAFYDANIEGMRHGELVRASQIFIGVPIGSMPAAQSKALTRAENALAALKAGEPFEDVAVRFSDEPDVAEARGDMGWLDRERSVSMFNEAIFSLNKDEISDLIETPLGYYIFKVTDLKEAGVEPFSAVRADIVEYLSGEKLTEAVRQRMAELEEAADIRILDPALKEIMSAPPASLQTDSEQTSAE
ncbi:hypothetical protein C4J81_08180 [Deltaproteobacteria bacterium Smac51]|nr:hypothetical protein C4J81_08180 [Deltaproteobacteria bacterium Smac51]